jgi:hypothetical protein
LKKLNRLKKKGAEAGLGASSAPIVKLWKNRSLYCYLIFIKSKFYKFDFK